MPGRRNDPERNDNSRRKGMEAKIRWIEGLTFVGSADSSHWVVMDTDVASGGAGGSASPMELVLLGLGGCTSMDVVSILRKMRVPIDRCETALDAERSGEHPKVFTKIRIEYRFWGLDLDRGKIEKAVDLSMTKYCSVSAMLGKSVSIEHSIRINP
jgi:putative redox protein